MTISRRTVLATSLAVPLAAPAIAQTPTVKIGVLNAGMLRRTRAYAVAVILIFAAFVAPSADPITMGVFAGPMFLLYELCIWIAYWMERAERRSR